MILNDIHAREETLFVRHDQKPFLIAGPCSAETEEQVLCVARDLARTGVDLFRAGIWKPRTRPNNVEGAGMEGLRLVQVGVARQCAVPALGSDDQAAHHERDHANGEPRHKRTF